MSEAAGERDALVESLELRLARRGADLERVNLRLEDKLAGKHEFVVGSARREAVLQERLAAHADEVRRLRIELAEERNRLSVMQASRSWRITAPLRRLSALRRRT